MKQKSVTSKVKSAYCFLFFFITQMSLLHYVTIHAAQTQNQKMMKKPPQKNKTKKNQNNKKKNSYALFSHLLKFI